jgi:hypothetical protein
MVARMGHRVLVISWGRAVRGREPLALDTYNDAVALLSEFEGDGFLESFDMVLLEPNGDIEGLVVIHGSGRQIAAVREHPRFRALMLQAATVSDGLRERVGSTGEGIADVLPLYQEAVGRLASSVT